MNKAVFMLDLTADDVTNIYNDDTVDYINS